MTAQALHYEPEPFGQRGVRPLFRPIIVGLCAIAVAVSASMWYRSQHNYDSIYHVGGDRSTQYASVLGRFMITTQLTNGRTPQGDSWTYESQEFGAIRDGWVPSAWKTLGVDWGTETVFRPSGQIQYWRFRLAWRTACIVSVLPIAIDAFIRRRRTPIGPGANVEGTEPQA